jgi:hypothetical protein
MHLLITSTHQFASKSSKLLASIGKGSQSCSLGRGRGRRPAACRRRPEQGLRTAVLGREHGQRAAGFLSRVNGPTAHPGRYSWLGFSRVCFSRGTQSEFFFRVHTACTRRLTWQLKPGKNLMKRCKGVFRTVFIV